MLTTSPHHVQIPAAIAREITRESRKPLEAAVNDAVTLWGFAREHRAHIVAIDLHGEKCSLHSLQADYSDHAWQHIPQKGRAPWNREQMVKLDSRVTAQYQAQTGEPINSYELVPALQFYLEALWVLRARCRLGLTDPISGEHLPFVRAEVLLRTQDMFMDMPER